MSNQPNETETSPPPPPPKVDYKLVTNEIPYHPIIVRHGKLDKKTLCRIIRLHFDLLWAYLLLLRPSNRHRSRLSKLSGILGLVACSATTTTVPGFSGAMHNMISVIHARVRKLHSHRSIASIGKLTRFFFWRNLKSRVIFNRPVCTQRIAWTLESGRGGGWQRNQHVYIVL